MLFIVPQKSKFPRAKFPFDRPKQFSCWRSSPLKYEPHWPWGLMMMRANGTIRAAFWGPISS